jgi:hypothetical protein
MRTLRCIYLRYAKATVLTMLDRRMLLVILRIAIHASSHTYIESLASPVMRQVAMRLPGVERR